MKKISTIYEKDVYSDKKSEEVTFEDRLTVKAIILDAEGRIGLVGNKQNDFLQLPGGGVDPAEDLTMSLKRECMEEVGCSILPISEVGCIDDYRSRDKKHCINYCYVVKVSGEKGVPSYTENEAKIGMYTKWILPKEALEIFEKQKQDLEKGLVTFYNTGFNILRDYLFLKQAMEDSLIK